MRPPCPHGLADPGMCGDCRRELGGGLATVVATTDEPMESLARRAWESSPAQRLAEHIRASGAPESGAWADAIETFSYLVYGTPLGAHARATFDARFGPFDWPADLA